MNKCDNNTSKNKSASLSFSGLVGWIQQPSAMLLLTVTIVGAVFLGQALIGIICGVALLMCFVAQLGGVIVKARKLKDRKMLARQSITFFVSALVSTLVILNLEAIDYIGTRGLVRVMEPYLLRQSKELSVTHSDVGSPFKYFRLHFSLTTAKNRWVVYDESDQVSWELQRRNTAWWVVSKESEEGESCLTKGRKLYSHFYVQYSGCN